MIPTVPGVTVATVTTDLPNRHRLLGRMWLAGYANANTRAVYERGLGKWFRFCEEHHTDPLAVVRTHIELWMRDLEQRRSPRTVAVYFAALSVFYKWLVDEEVLLRDPTRRIKPPKTVRLVGRKWLSRPQVADLLAAANTDPQPTAAALVHLLVCNGLRIGEACSLNVEDVGVMDFLPTVRFIRKGGDEGEAKFARPTELAVNRAIAGRDRGPLLVTRYHTRMNQKAAQRIIDRLAPAIHGPHDRITPHMLRHTAATMALLAGVPLDQILHDFGWRDASMINEIYGHAHHAPMRAATHAITAFVYSAA